MSSPAGANVTLTGCVEMLRTFAVCAVASLMLAVPAHAAGWVVLPDPSGATLFALGIAGLLIGRRIASRRKD